VAQVNVTINGRQFRMACEDGEEDHLRGLAQNLDERIGSLRGQFGEIGDARLTVMAALMLADSLSEINSKVRRLEDELAALQDAGVAASQRSNMTQATVAEAVTAAAERIESLARKLNQAGGSSEAPEQDQ
jgi:cell division protein ZapA